MPTRWSRRSGAPTEPIAAAKVAGLRYITDSISGIGRQRRGRSFVYLTPSGARIRDEDELRRIRRLAIPPAWTDVWISPYPDGHVQATGRDGRGRKQYRYHPRWRAVRDETKYARMLAFAEALPRLRARVISDLARPGLGRATVLATVVRLLESTFVRVGNEEYARTNGAYGLTTLRRRHAAVVGATIRFRFRGKGGKLHEVGVRDRRLARIIRRCQDLPGQELFQYVARDGTLETVGSADVNAYLREATGDDFTAKDFRTWAGTVLAAVALDQLGPAGSRTAARSRLNRAIGAVAETLGNTLAVCRRCYVHPTVIDAYLDGETLRTFPAHRRPRVGGTAAGLSTDETATCRLLRARVAARLRGGMRRAA